MRRKIDLSLSPAARELQLRALGVMRDYESILGAVPAWLNELDIHQALGLVAACQRIGMQLPTEETLHGDARERRAAARQAQVLIRSRSNSRNVPGGG